MKDNDDVVFIVAELHPPNRDLAMHWFAEAKSRMRNSQVALMMRREQAEWRELARHALHLALCNRDGRWPR